MSLDLARWFRFVRDFAWYGFAETLGRHLVLAALLALPAAILLLRLGRALGIPLLFFHEDRRKQILAGFAVALLGSEIFFVNFLLERQPGAVIRWLRELPAEIQAQPLRQLTYHLLGSWSVLAALVVLVLAARFLLKGSPDMTAPMPMAPDFRLKGDLLPRWPLLLGLGLGIAAAYAATRAAPAVGDWLAVRLTGLGTPPSDLPLHLLAALFFTVFALLFAVGAWLPRWTSTPATALCTGLALIAAAYGYLAFHGASPVLVGLLLALALAVAGLAPYKLRVRSLAARYAAPEAHYPAGEPAAPLLKTTDIAWAPAGQRRPLVIVCASGGGIRASVWTAAVLAALEERLPQLPHHIRLVTGASGGMVGAGYYVATLDKPGKPSAEDRATVRKRLIDQLARDSLSDLAKALVFRDLPGMFWPWPILGNRGNILEETWDENLSPGKEQRAAGRTTYTFSDLRDGEREGWRPSLIFSPMLVEDGRRLLISNLDLAGLLRNELPSDAPAFQSCSGFELARLFPAAWPAFPVATAARLSASFPWVTPAPVLPTRPRRRVVDAGYYDNYGVNLACAWLDELRARHLDWLRTQVSGIAVVQIRDEVLGISAPPAGVGPLPDGSALGRGLEELSSPPRGLLSAHTASPVFRNDEQLEAMANHFAGLTALYPELPPGFFTTVRFSFAGTVSLSWYLTQREKDSLCAQAAQVAEGPEGTKLRDWFAARG
jgi:hypothetical protein